MSPPASPLARAARAYPLAFTAVAMELFLPGLTKWQSHYVTILFSSLLATIAAYAIMRRVRSASCAVQRSEERFRALTENAPDIVSVMQPDGTITFKSESIRRELGYDPAEIVGRNLFEFLHPDESDRVRESLREVVATPGHHSAMEMRFRHHDGSWRTLAACSRNLLHDPAVEGIVVNSRDVTAHRAAEAGQLRLQARLEYLLSASPVVIFSCDPARAYAPTFMSRNVEAICGYPAEEFVGDAAAWSALINEDDSDRFFAALAPLLDTGRAQQEYRVRHRDGSSVWVREEVRLIRDPATAEPSELVGCRIDITERKWAEGEAERAKREADRANQAKTDFLARTSHELRTPLNAILGFSQLLQLARLDAHEAESVEQILRAGRHLLELVNEVLDIAGVESGRVSFSLEPVRLADRLREALDLVRPLAAAQQVSLEWDAAGTPDFYIYADAQRLTQVLLNLLANAVKFNRTGGSATLSCEVDFAERVRIIVRDTGIGIAPERMERMFTPFERLGAERGGVPGTGLGLALSKRLVEAMGGTIGAESTPGTGSTFWIKLPRAQRPVLPEHAASSAAEPATPAPPATVLYIEDNLSNLKLIESVFAQRPATRLLVAMQGRTGLDLARTQSPDLILLDLHLPDLMGSEVLAMLQADPATHDVPVIMLSADATPSQTARLLTAGARDYLTKPLDVRNFLAVIDRVLGAPGERQKEES